MQHTVVWYRFLLTGTGGPSSIIVKAWKTDPVSFPSWRTIVNVTDVSQVSPVQFLVQHIQQDIAQ